MRRVKDWPPKLAMLLALTLASPALAEDFKMINGKEYKNATVSRVEADGIVLKSKSGIAKIYFFELPKEVQERFHYGSAMPALVDADRFAQQVATKLEERESILHGKEAGNAVTQRIDQAQSATDAAAFVDADRFAQQIATKLEERGKRAKTRSWESMAIQELNFHNAFLAGIAIVASVLFAIVWARFNNEQTREQSSK